MNGTQQDPVGPNGGQWGSTGMNGTQRDPEVTSVDQWDPIGANVAQRDPRWAQEQLAEPDTDPGAPDGGRGDP